MADNIEIIETNINTVEIVNTSTVVTPNIIQIDILETNSQGPAGGQGIQGPPGPEGPVTTLIDGGNF